MLIAALTSVLLCAVGPTQSAPAATDASDTMVLMDFAKAPHYRENEIWVGKAVSDVLPASAVSRILLLAAETSAPANIDAANIRRLLSPAFHFEHAAPGWEESPLVWDAILETSDGRLFHIKIYREWAQLVSPHAHGFFRAR